MLVPESLADGPARLWPKIAARFRIVPASAILSMSRMERCQDARVAGLTERDELLGLFFISHRWQSISHPDPSGDQLRGLQELLRKICFCIEAMMVRRDQRMHLVKSLKGEGWLQAEELARRLLGYGPFSDHPSWLVGSRSRARVQSAFASFADDRHAFRRWIADRFGVWLDYLCMPQEPLVPDDVLAFRLAMESLGTLVMTSTVITLRFDGDEYATRGWCAMEHFLGSARSFSRGVFVDISRMARSEEVLIPSPPVADLTTPDFAASSQRDAYDQDREAFLGEVARWSEAEPPFVEIGPPDPWARYRDLQGSGFYPVDKDPNPFRRTLEAVLGFETMLIEQWLFAEKAIALDLGQSVVEILARFGLRCSKEADVLYLGFLMAANGWIAEFRPMLDACAARTVALLKSVDATSLLVTLEPPNDEARRLIRGMNRVSSMRWHSDFGARAAPDARVDPSIQKLHDVLQASPLAYSFPAS